MQPAPTPADDTPPAPSAPVIKAPGFVARIVSRFQSWLATRQFRAVPTSIALVCVMILLGLGSWQLQRLHWKNGVLHQAQEQFKLPPLDLRGHLPVADIDWSALHYKPVIVSGRWLTPFHPIKLAPRTYDEQAGYQLIIPMVLPDNQIILVNRGFAPDTAGVLPPEKLDAVIRGVAYQPETTRPRFMPENLPKSGLWVWPDVAAMGREIGRNHIAPIMIYEDRRDKQSGFPIGGQLPLPSLNSHRQYAVTWYALALALLGVWLMASNVKPLKETPPKTTAANDDQDKAKQINDPVARRGMYPEATD